MAKMLNIQHVNEDIYTLAQAKADSFAKNHDVKKFYYEMEAEYQLKSQLIESRIAAGLNQKQLAEKIRTKQSAISRYEKEDCFQMSIKQLCELPPTLKG